MEKYIIFAGRKVPINMNYPVLLYDNGTGPSYYHPELTLSPEKLVQMELLRPTRQNFCARFGRGMSFNRTYEQLFGITRDEIDALGQHICQIALHHDVTMNAMDTFNVLCTRGLSTHFCVNYDGTLYQYMDPYHMAWATGENNNVSVAIDMNNPVYPELRNEDPANGMRDLYQGKINGSLKTMLGYTEPQYETIIALIKALISPVMTPGEVDPWIPLPIVAENCFPPISETGEVINRLLRDSTKFRGFLGHYHCSANKWDPGPAFDWLRVLSGIKGKRNSLPMLIGEPGERRNLSECGGQVLADLLTQYYRNAETASGGWYPVGANQSWHSGIHLTGEEGTPILNMMEGTIVAVRNVRTVDLGDPSFVLVRHEREEDDESGNPHKVYWYSLFMHLHHMVKDEEFRAVPWVSELLGPDIEAPDKIAYNMDANARNYERGVPHVVDGTVKSKNPNDILDGFFRGDIILTNIPCGAGVQVGTIGVFGNTPDQLRKQVHIEVFSSENIFQHGNAQKNSWLIIEGDSSEYSLVRVKKLLRPIREFVQGQTGKVPTLLKSSEIGGFYGMGDKEYLSARRDDFRRMICFHRSEWSPLMNWTKTAIQSVGWQWESEASFGKWLLLWLPFQWMTKDVTTALDLPSKHYFFTYHPIFLLEQLNQTYAGDISQTAEEAGESEFRDNVNEVSDRLNELIRLNRKLENKEELSDAEKQRHEELYQLMDDHLDDERATTESETRYDYFYDSRFEQWEPGEWLPPGHDDLNKI